MKTNWQDPGTTEILSSHISGLQEAVGKIEDSIGLQTTAETAISLVEVYINADDRYRIFQAPLGKRNWVASPAPVVKKNGVTITTGFTIDYGGGAIVLETNTLSTDAFTADFTRTNDANSLSGVRTARFIIGTSTAGWISTDCDYLCNGTADQTEINAAITALPATGGEIVILDGTYNITQRINVTKDNVSIRGNGNATILKRMFYSLVKEGVITLTSRSGCKIANLQVDGNRTSYANSKNSGIYLSGSSNTVTDNTCYDSYGSGIYLSGSSNTVTDNTCYNNRDSGIYLSGSNNNTVTDNTCYDSYGSGIYLSGSSNNTITGNTCNNDGTGIYLDSSSNNTITGNTCIRETGEASDYTVAQHTIRLYGTDNNYNLISNNNCMGKAVTSEGGTGNTLVNNKFDAS